jgi:hypothetical protein
MKLNKFCRQEGRKETVIQLLTGIVAIGDYFKFERAVSL